MGSNSTARLIEKLNNREKIFSAYIGQVTSPQFAPAYASSGTDMLVADLEHGTLNPENVGDFAVECNKYDFPVIARIQDCEYHCISKCIDQGCDGILVPRTETIEQVELAISSMRFFPIGKKGVGGRACLRGDSIDEFNKKRLIFLQIESPKGVDNLDEMLTKYSNEIAGIIIGPSDMSIMCGCPLEYDNPILVEQIRRTVKICQSHGKSVGMFMNNLDWCKRWYDEGMNIFWMAGEVEFMKLGLKAVVDGIGAM